MRRPPAGQTLRLDRMAQTEPRCIVACSTAGDARLENRPHSTGNRQAAPQPAAAAGALRSVTTMPRRRARSARRQRQPPVFRPVALPSATTPTTASAAHRSMWRTRREAGCDHGSRARQLGTGLLSPAAPLGSPLGRIIRQRVVTAVAWQPPCCNCLMHRQSPLSRLPHRQFVMQTAGIVLSTIGTTCFGNVTPAYQTDIHLRDGMPVSPARRALDWRHRASAITGSASMDIGGNRVRNIQHRLRQNQP